MELTRETIELLADGSIALDYVDTKIMAKQILAEMDAPKVWTNAPDNAIIAQVHFYKTAKTYATPSAIPEVYTREPPKSSARKIAEECVHEHINKETMDRSLADIIESAILRDREERYID